MGIGDRTKTGEGGALLREAKQFCRRAIGKKRDRGEVAPEQAEEIQLPMRQIVDAILIEVELGGVIPAIADAIHGPFGGVARRAASLDRMQIAHENIFGEAIVVRVRADPQADVILRDAIAANPVAVALIEGQTDGVLRDLILLETAVVG